MRHLKSFKINEQADQIEIDDWVICQYLSVDLKYLPHIISFFKENIGQVATKEKLNDRGNKFIEVQFYPTDQKHINTYYTDLIDGKYTHDWENVDELENVYMYIKPQEVIFHSPIKQEAEDMLPVLINTNKYNI